MAAFLREGAGSVERNSSPRGCGPSGADGRGGTDRFKPRRAKPGYGSGIQSDALPGVAEKVAGRVPLLLDSGIRRGTDVLKALALGAKAVLIGRPDVHGLAVGGAEGVARVVNILRVEFEMAMALVGCASIERINRSILWPS